MSVDTQALEIGEKLRSAVLACRLPWIGHELSVGASVGLVAVEGNYPSVPAVIRAADAACYVPGTSLHLVGEDGNRSLVNSLEFSQP